MIVATRRIPVAKGRQVGFEDRFRQACNSHPPKGMSAGPKVLLTGADDQA